jgi:hypothetical protein
MIVYKGSTSTAAEIFAAKDVKDIIYCGRPEHNYMVAKVDK